MSRNARPEIRIIQPDIPRSVTPAQAGVQRHFGSKQSHWVPACAGTTSGVQARFRVLHPVADSPHQSTAPSTIRHPCAGRGSASLRVKAKSLGPCLRRDDERRAGQISCPTSRCRQPPPNNRTLHDPSPLRRQGFSVTSGQSKVTGSLPAQGRRTECRPEFGFYIPLPSAHTNQPHPPQSVTPAQAGVQRLIDSKQHFRLIP
jgi:hypothetical protein